MLESAVSDQTLEQDRATRDAAQLSWRLPSPEAIAAGALDTGLAHAARMLDIDQEAVADLLRRGDGVACQRYRYALAKQVAGALGALDEGVKAVFVAHYDATPRDTCFCTPGADPRIHLIVWARRRTHALDALVAAIDRALLVPYRRLMGTPELASLLDVQVIDDSSVEQRVGYGAMLSSIHNQPLPLWERE